MSTDATRAPKDFKDLYTDLVNRIREQTGKTATDNQAKRYINLALLDMHIGTDYKYPWAERSGTLRTKAKYTTGTIHITKGDSKIIGAGTAFQGNDAFLTKNCVAGGKIVINGTDEVYELASVESNTQATLTTDYIGDSIVAADAATFIYFEDEYTLENDFLRFVDARSFNPTRYIPIVSRTDFRRMAPANDTTGYPEIATIQDKAFSGSADPIRMIRVSRSPDKEYLIPYDYITNELAVTTAGVAQEVMSADTDEPIVPYRYRAALTYFALAIWYRDKKDDLKRAQSAQQDYNTIMTRISDDQEVGAPRAKLRPRNGVYTRGARRPFRGGRRAISAEGFDEMRDRY